MEKSKGRNVMKVEYDIICLGVVAVYSLGRVRFADDPDRTAPADRTRALSPRGLGDWTTVLSASTAPVTSTVSENGRRTRLGSCFTLGRVDCWADFCCSIGSAEFRLDASPASSSGLPEADRPRRSCSLNASDRMSFWFSPLSDTCC